MEHAREGSANASPSQDGAESPLILHLINRLATGGLENGLVNLINHMPIARYRHVIVCLTDFTDFRDRITRADVDVLAIHKKSGIDWRSYMRIWRVIRRLNPVIVHTRNLPTMEYAIVAMFAGVPIRVHGEHGRDVHDQYGTSVKFRLFRKFLSLWIHIFITVSEDLARWFETSIGIDHSRIRHIYNGVDSQRFHPATRSQPRMFPPEFSSPEYVVVGTVGRLQAVKDQTTLVNAFLHLRQAFPELLKSVRLVLVGDGAMRDNLEGLVKAEGIGEYVWMAGERHDIPDLLRAFNVFVLPSEAEGISNTILEAMASGLPVIATDVGGNTELVQHGKTGYLVPPKNPSAMAQAIAMYAKDEKLVEQHGRAGRALVEERFSLHAMIDRYTAVYDGLVNGLPVRG
ncbi:MAG: TIGR03088 family PEP-CTERM/XrtA system glycosyltransferase [Nitrospirales bacterium]|nr:TIGR03088 family PEP-CTERM/XrtA system glycosyltransferase [Nitrospira sp.]MDR4501903.1 TIGR03088 family PEP-CTERM/XrtA system glycosyltransferase [Nitrospirales bacterium]